MDCPIQELKALGRKERSCTFCKCCSPCPLFLPSPEPRFSELLSETPQFDSLRSKQKTPREAKVVLCGRLPRLVCVCVGGVSNCGGKTLLRLGCFVSVFFQKQRRWRWVALPVCFRLPRCAEIPGESNLNAQVRRCAPNPNPLKPCGAPCIVEMKYLHSAGGWILGCAPAVLSVSSKSEKTGPGKKTRTWKRPVCV